MEILKSLSPNQYNIQFATIQAISNSINENHQSKDSYLKSKSKSKLTINGQILFFGNNADDNANAELFMIKQIVNMALRSRNAIEKISELTRALDYCNRITRQTGIGIPKHHIYKHIGKYFGDQGHFHAQLDYIKEAIQILNGLFKLFPYREKIEANLMFWLCDSYLNLDKPLELVEAIFEFLEKTQAKKIIYKNKNTAIDWHEVYIVYVLLEIYEEAKKQCEKLISWCQLRGTNENETKLTTSLDAIEENLQQVLENFCEMNELVCDLKCHIHNSSFTTNKNK